ncbi:hypothetical protein [Streptomyces sp. NPDC097619]|uniref:hypothetical protein n=1 Tax=Streptomyces sp. NPDC097619 TaxID=3157228 RepID=UPI00332CBB5B
MGREKFGAARTAENGPEHGQDRGPERAYRSGTSRDGSGGAEGVPREPGPARAPLWVEEPVGRRRMPDPVRKAAVRAVLLVSVMLMAGSTAFYLAVAGSWLAFPMVVSAVAATVVATWGVLDVWITRQAWHQRYGVISVPASTARRLRRERRRARRAARTAQRGGKLGRARTAG